MLTSTTPNHTILFTTLPDGISINKTPLPVSVLVSPRLSGDDKLGAFPDWLNWTERLKSHGAEVVFENNGQTLNVPVDTAPLRPDLWASLFNEETLVRFFQYTDLTDRPVLSYPLRMTLSALKAVYQIAGIDLALPVGEGATRNAAACAPCRICWPGLMCTGTKKRGGHGARKWL